MLGNIRYVILGAMAIFLLLGNVSAQSFYCVSTGSSTSITDSAINSCITGTVVPYVVIALLLSFAIIAIAYLIGEVFGISSLKGWYKVEVWEITKTLLLVAVIFSLIIILGAIATSINGQSNTNLNLGTMYSSSENYLANQFGIASNAFDNMLGISLGINYLSSIRISTYYYYKVFSTSYLDTETEPPTPSIAVYFVPAGVPNTKSCPFNLPALATIGGQAYAGPVIPPGCAYIGAVDFGSNASLYQSDLLSVGTASGKGFSANTLNMLIVPTFLILGAELAILPALAYAGLGVFLPLGIILRAIPFLRGVGGTLLALGLAFSIFYPATLIALNIPISNLFAPNISTQQFYPFSPPSATDCSAIWSLPGIGGLCDYINQLATDPLFITQIDAAFGGPTGPLANGYETGVFGSFSGILPSINSILTYSIPVILQFLLLVFDLIIVYALTNGAAKMLGGTIKLGIGKMKIA
jgi:hypothetical protein